MHVHVHVQHIHVHGYVLPYNYTKNNIKWEYKIQAQSAKLARLYVDQKQHFANVDLLIQHVHVGLNFVFINC